MERSPYILVTGASSGIGSTIARKLSACCPVILHGRNKERLEEVCRQCVPDFHPIIWQADLGQIESIENELISFISAKEMTIKGFVHCAGVMKMLPLKMLSSEFLIQMFKPNFFSAVLLLKVLMQKKINKGSLSSVVLISSNISERGAKAFSGYAATKGALDSFMRCMAVELAPKVRINSVLPGAIQTEMTEHIYENEEVVNRMIDTYPLGAGKPEDISEMVEFLLSERARWITGQQFVVDGGRIVNISG